MPSVSTRLTISGLRNSAHAPRGRNKAAIDCNETCQGLAMIILNSVLISLNVNFMFTLQS